MPGKCDGAIPTLLNVEPTHQVSCFLYEEGD
jgi:hypothetical protein